MKLSKIILIPIVVVSLLTLSIFGIATYKYMERQINGIYTTQILSSIRSLEDEMQFSQEVSDLVMGSFDRKNLALARALAEIVRLDGDRVLNYSAMDRLAQLLDVDEVHVMDGDGYLRYGNEPAYYGMDFNTTDQTRPFLQILQDPALELAQEPMPNGSQGWWFQYAGVARQDDRGFVQVGIAATVAAELEAMLDIQNKVKLTTVGQTGCMAIIRDGVYTAHKDSGKIGASVTGEPWYSVVSGSPQGFSWLEIDGDEHLVGYSAQNGTITMGMLPRSEYLSGLNNLRNMCVFLICSSSLVLIVVLFACLRRFVLIPIEHFCMAMRHIADGNLDMTVEGHYSGEFGDLKEAINHTIHQLNLYIREISTTLSMLSQDNYDVSISGEYQGDFKPIQEGLGKIIARINTVMQSISESAGQVADSSQAIFQSNQALSDGSARQTRSVEQLLESVDSVLTRTRSTSETSRSASELSTRTAERAQQGDREMQDMLQAMREIEEVTDGISRIVQTIEDLAMQTNLLALNASVEAVRAGQAGKGFMVVADQVRLLATSSQTAVQDTSLLLDKTVQKIRHGTGIADRTAHSLREISDGVNRMKEGIRTIAQDADAQDDSIRQINLMIGQIAEYTKSNNAVSLQTALNAEALSRQSAAFRQMVSHFRLKRNAVSAGAPVPGSPGAERSAFPPPPGSGKVEADA